MNQPIRVHVRAYVICVPMQKQKIFQDTEKMSKTKHIWTNSTLDNTKRAIKNGQFRHTWNIGYTIQ